MKKEHKHAVAIRGLAAGEQIQVKNSGVWLDCAFPDFDPESEYRIKPTEPEKLYPVTQMDVAEIYHIYQNAHCGEDGKQDYVAIANFALRHAVDHGYLFTPEQAKKMANESFHFGVDNALAGMPKQDTAERDQKVAQAVYLAAQNILDARMTFAIEHARKAMLTELLESLPAIVKEVKP